MAEATTEQPVEAEEQQEAQDPQEPQEQSEEQAEGEGQPEGVEVGDAEMPEADATAAPAGPPGQIDLLLDSEIEVSAALGETRMFVRDLLSLGPGSVVKLDRKMGEPVDLFMRGVKFAEGQLVVVGEHLGVRVKEILAPPEPDEE